MADQGNKLRAAIRDASWYRNPSTHGKDLVYHVVRADIHQGEGACGVAVIATEGRHRQDATLPAENIRPEYRCRRPGCKARWPEFVDPDTPSAKKAR